jgi:hypothetical protein
MGSSFHPALPISEAVKYAVKQSWMPARATFILGPYIVCLGPHPSPPTWQSDTRGKAGGLMSGAASKAVSRNVPLAWWPAALGTPKG